VSDVVFRRKDLLDLQSLSSAEIRSILELATSLKQVSARAIKKVPTLKGRTVINLFCEPSTRTRASFELAEKRLSADAINIQASSSSTQKGETLLDTAKNLMALQPDIIVIRHSASGAAHLVAEVVPASVINAGDGCHEHPTQGLLDLFTIQEQKGSIAGVRVAIVGDIMHSRVARSNIYALTKLGARVTVCGPATMLPVGIETLGVAATTDLREAVEGADVVMALRLQLERQKTLIFPSLREYAAQYGLNRQSIRWMKSDVVIMHPGPINRGVEVSSEIADGPQSVILDQVTNGLAVRMAVLYLLGNRS